VLRQGRYETDTNIRASDEKVTGRSAAGHDIRDELVMQRQPPPYLAKIDEVAIGGSSSEPNRHRLDKSQRAITSSAVVNDAFDFVIIHASHHNRIHLDGTKSCGPRGVDAA
jgi:hypothetical protein